MANEQIVFLSGLVLIITVVLALCVLGFVRTKKRYEKNQGLLQKPETAKILKMIFLGMVAAGIICGIIGFVIFSF